MNLGGDADEALFSLLSELRRADYCFVTVTPETHGRIVKRPAKAQATDLRDIFGWNLPFTEGALPPEMLDLLAAADAIERDGSLFRSRLRVATLDGRLYLHSCYPTDDQDSVFFGPDSYRFAAFLRAELPRIPRTWRLVDLGTGAGVGAITAAALVPEARLTIVDVNPAALRLAAINARHAGVTVEPLLTGSIADVPGLFDLVIANPPYIADENSRSYRDGGEMLGARLSLDWALASAARLQPGGRMLLYTGSAIIDGRDELREALEAELHASGCTLEYRELDPDVFGEELDRPAYARAERIAVIGAVIAKSG
jgi:methylase of polypeptide subunit release factors